MATRPCAPHGGLGGCGGPCVRVGLGFPWVTKPTPPCPFIPGPLQAQGEPGGPRGVRHADLPVAAEAGWERTWGRHTSLCNKCQLRMSTHLVVCFKMLKIRLFSFKNVTTQLQLRRAARPFLLRARSEDGAPRGAGEAKPPESNVPAGPSCPGSSSARSHPWALGS